MKWDFVQQKNLFEVFKLKNNKIKKDKDGDRAIHHAAFGNEPAVVELMWSHHNNLQINAINEKQQTALHIAVNKALIEVVKVLLNLGANVCVQDNDGDTPLHDAITKEKNEIVDLLLNANSDLATRNKNGFNCVHQAALRGNARYVDSFD